MQTQNLRSAHKDGDDDTSDEAKGENNFFHVGSCAGEAGLSKAGVRDDGIMMRSGHQNRFAVLVEAAGVELEAFSRRERSGSLLPKS